MHKNFIYRCGCCENDFEADVFGVYSPKIPSIFESSSELCPACLLNRFKPEEHNMLYYFPPNIKLLEKEPEEVKDMILGHVERILRLFHARIRFLESLEKGTSGTKESHKVQEKYDEIAKVFNRDPSVARPSDILKGLNEYVIGQTSAKEGLSVLMSNHMHICNDAQKSSQPLDKSNCIIVGPSGSGKTEMIRTIQKTLNRTLIVVDASEFTAAGYHGRDVNTIITELYEAAGGDVYKAESGIVFIDEIDKIAGSVNSDVDVGGRGVQRELLKMVEGTIKTVPNELGSKQAMSSAPSVSIDTTNILFIFAGAFSDLMDKKHAVLDGKARSMGFHANIAEDAQEKANNVTHEELIDEGMMPELMGRIGTILCTTRLTKRQYIDILYNVPNSSLKQAVRLFKLHNKDLTIKKDTIIDIVKQAYKSPLGYRAVKLELDKRLNPLLLNNRKKKVTI